MYHNWNFQSRKRRRSDDVYEKQWDVALCIWAPSGGVGRRVYMSCCIAYVRPWCLASPAWRRRGEPGTARRWTVSWSEDVHKTWWYGFMSSLFLFYAVLKTLHLYHSQHYYWGSCNFLSWCSALREVAWYHNGLGVATFLPSVSRLKEFALDKRWGVGAGISSFYKELHYIHSEQSFEVQ